MKYYYFLLLVLIPNKINSQTIESLLKKEWKNSDSSIVSITEITTYFGTSKSDLRKRVYEYGHDGLLLVRTQWDQEGKISWRNSYSYDSINNLSSVKSEKWNHSLGYKFDITKYNYDSSGLASFYYYNNLGVLESYSIIQNENKLPVQINSYYPNNEMIGYEIAKYNLEINRVFITTFNKEGKQIGNTREFIIDDSIEKEIEFSNNKYDKYGNLIQNYIKSCYSCEDYSTYQFEYKYDEKYNWIKQSKYIIENSSKNKLQVIKRNIKYNN